MKYSRPLLLALLAVCALGFGAVRWFALTRELALLKQDNGKLTAAAAAASDKSQALEAEAAQLRAARALAGPRLEPVESASTPAPPSSDEPKPKSQGGVLAKMFENPEMRKMMAAQQTAALRGLYGDYARQANLSPDEENRFFQLLQDRQMALMDSSAKMMTGGAIDMKAATAATNTTDEALKYLLGDARYAQYQEFEKALPDRVQVLQFSHQLSAQGAPLTDSQVKVLIQIMSEERLSAPSFVSENAPGSQQALSMSPADVDRYSRLIDSVNGRVYKRAASILTAPQLNTFAVFQRNMATAQVASLKMTQEMFKSDQ